MGNEMILQLPLSVYDSISLVCEKMADINFLRQNIREDYFEAYDRDNADGRFSIAWEYNRYGALFRIMDLCLDNVYKMLCDAEAVLDEQHAASKE